MFSHVHIGTSDLGRAVAFYDAVLAPLGIARRFVAEKRGWAGWQGAGHDRPLFLVGRPLEPVAHAAGHGQMVAFDAATRGQVDQCHAIALERGAADAGRPGLRPEYHAAYYGAYFRDPDGNKICVCCHRED